MKTIEHEYYEWLKRQIWVPPDRTFNSVLEMMHGTEFHWTVPNDNNRLVDGLDLRTEFLNNRRPTINHYLELDGATVLEVVIGISRRLAFQTGGDQEKWAYKLLKNVGFSKYPDPLSDEDIFKVGDMMDALIWRTYRSNGRGGFFPLKHPEEDQRKVEIWNQMNKYLLERDHF